MASSILIGSTIYIGPKADPLPAIKAAKAGAKAAGVVIDDAAVTPRYLAGFAASRELPVIGKIAVGSLRNKLFILLPAALILSVLMPWVITPLLMLGAAYLCYEGAEKVFESVLPHEAHAHEAKLPTVAINAQTLEDEKTASAIKTDFILSAEIMAITLAALPEGSLVMKAMVLAATAPLATAAADPDDDPPGTRSRLHGFFTRPREALKPEGS